MPIVYVPFVDPMLSDETLDAVKSAGVEYQLVQLDIADPYGYARFVGQLWLRGETFIICEQDVVPTEKQLHTIVSCGHKWCDYQYDTTSYPVGKMMGLCRFDSTILKAYPWVPGSALHVGTGHEHPVVWWNVDNRIARDLDIRHVEHVLHTPEVKHLHRRSWIRPYEDHLPKEE